MELADLLSETLDRADQDVWKTERIPTPVRRLGVRLNAPGPSSRETFAILGPLGAARSHGAVWKWVHTLTEGRSGPPTAESSRVAFGENQIEIDGERKWLYAAIDTGSKLLAGQSIKREAVAAAVQTLLQPTSTESGTGWPDPYRGGSELDSAVGNCF